MSASKDRILRKQQIEAGTDKRTVAAAKEAAERKKTTIRYSVIAAIIVIVFAFVFIYNSAIPAKTTTAVTIDGEKYTVAQLNYYYSSSYMNFYNNYYSYISYGLFFDPQTSLATQDYSEDMTWREYFIEAAIDSMTEIKVLNTAAEKEGFELSDEMLAEYNETVESIRTGWKDLGYSSLKQYLGMNYGKGVTMEIIEKELYRTYVASAYSNHLFDSYEYSAEELAAYHTEHADEMDTIDYAYYAIYDDEETPIDAAAVAAAVNGTDEEEFTSYLSENADGAEPTVTSAAGENLNTVYASWLLDAARKAGDATALSSEDGSTTYVVMFLGRDAGDYKLVNFRHILINALDADGDGAYSDDELAAAEANANQLYDEWQAGTADEASFAELANAYSEDGGSNTNGGLYENVYKGQMVGAINEWLFEDGRKTGDTTVVTNNGTYTGAHVVYFVGTGDQTYADYQADQTMRNEAFNTWMAEAEEAADVQIGSTKLAGQNH